MIHTGVDLVNIPRIKKSLDEHQQNFLNRICTEAEIENLKKENRKVEKVAALFALKEAFSKALGTGIGDKFSFKDLEVIYKSSGQPQINYIGEHFRYFSARWNLSCSVSHDADMLIAIVLIDGELP